MKHNFYRFRFLVIFSLPTLISQKIKSFESITTTNAISENNNMVVKESFTVTITYVCTIYANGAWEGVGKCERNFLILYIN